MSFFYISCNQDVIQSVLSSIYASPLPHSAFLYPGAASLMDQTFRQVRVAGRLQDMKKYLHIFLCLSMRSQSHGNVFFFRSENACIHTYTYLFMHKHFFFMQKQVASQFFILLNPQFLLKEPWQQPKL